tara:strand:+ start:92 stop:238 length:147 start_codon:yes stop_codon:yes gene_type:complete
MIGATTKVIAAIYQQKQKAKEIPPIKAEYPSNMGPRDSEADPLTCYVS